VLGIDEAVGEDVLAGDEQGLVVGADPPFAEIRHGLGVGVEIQADGVEVSARRLDDEGVGGQVGADDVAGDEIGMDVGGIGHGAPSDFTERLG